MQQPCSSCTSHFCSLLQLTPGETVQLIGPVAEGACGHLANALRRGVMPPVLLAGDQFVFTIEEGANGHNGRISVNYDGFIEDVSVGDILLVDGGLQSLKITGKDGKDVHTEVVDGGTMKSRQGTCYATMLLSALVHADDQGSCARSLAQLEPAEPDAPILVTEATREGLGLSASAVPCLGPAEADPSRPCAFLPPSAQHKMCNAAGSALVLPQEKRSSNAM